MGYTTWFTGSLKTDKPVTNEFMDYINAFAEVRHMVRNVDKIKEIFPNWEKQCFNGNIGTDGQYFVGEIAMSDIDTSIVDFNRPADDVPGLWCQWVMNNNSELEWDGGEKFYNYTEWLKYLIKNFFEPSDYILNGEIEFQGEDEDDFGTIRVVDNEVDVKYGMRIMDLSEIDTTDLVMELTSRGYTVQN